MIIIAKKKKTVKKSMPKKGVEKSLSDGLKYPWVKARRLWNILWILIPILGYFALVGYSRKILVDLVKGKGLELPEFGSFWKNFSDGVKIFVFMVPSVIVLMVLQFIPILGQPLYWLVVLFVFPWLIMNFLVKDKFDALWDVKKCVDQVLNNAAEYVIALLKTIVFAVVYGILSLVLVGIPAYQFGVWYFLADFYKKHN